MLGVVHPAGEGFKYAAQRSLARQAQRLDFVFDFGIPDDTSPTRFTRHVVKAGDITEPDVVGVRQKACLQRRERLRATIHRHVPSERPISPGISSVIPRPCIHLLILLVAHVARIAEIGNGCPVTAEL